MKLIYFVTLFYFVKACKDLEILTIEVIQNEDLDLVLDLDKDGAKSCTFTSDTTNHVLTNVTNHTMMEDNMTVYFYKWTNACSIKLKNIQNNYDMNWKIVAEYEYENNCTKEFKLSFFYFSELINKFIFPTEGASFMQYFLLDQELKSCYAIIDGVNITLSSKDDTAIIPKTFPLKDRLKGVGRDKCGVRVNFVQKDDPVNYTLYGTDEDNKVYKAMFKFKLRKYKMDNITVEVESGGFGTVPCTTRINDVNSDGYCSLYNPNGKRVVYKSKECGLSIDVTTDKLGYWRCVKNVPLTMQDIELFIHVKLKTPQPIARFVKKMENFTIIGCRSYKTYGDLDFCRMASPNNKSYFIQAGATTDRITTLTLDLKNRICSIEIKNPLQDDERGMWKCYIDDESINLNVDTSETMKYKNYIKENTKLKENFLIDCQVPYYSEYCYILSPNGTKYNPDRNSNPLIGECSHVIEHVNKYDNGTWQCLFARKAGEPMDIIKYDVLVADRMFYYKEIEVNAGDDASLMCSTEGVGLEYCMYVSPSKDIYYVKDNQTSSTISYDGDGLSYGDCGIMIHKIQSKDAGNWKCIAKIRNGEETTMALFVTVLEPSFDEPVLATALGVGFGALIVIGVGLGYFLFRRRKLNRQRLNGPENVVFQREMSTNIGDGERVALPITRFTPNNYDTSGNLTSGNLP